MFLLREPPWLLALTGAVGWLCGRARGRAGWGLLLGLLLGPFGCLAVMLFPRAQPRPDARFRAFGDASGGPGPGSGPSRGDSVCPRCEKPVGRRDKACGHCGNVLIPIRYAVEP